MKNFRLSEYMLLFYRIALVYVFYFFARVVFYLYNTDAISIASTTDFFRLCYYGLLFDNTAIMYVNALFILLSLLPLLINTQVVYQKILKGVYFFTNILAYLMTFVDVIYFAYNKSRISVSAWALVKNETNMGAMAVGFLEEYWHLALLYLVLLFLWWYLYGLVKIEEQKVTKKLPYFAFSTLIIVLVTPLVIYLIRGLTFAHGTLPLAPMDASRYAKNISEVNVILNTPFFVFRTLDGTDSFKLYHFTNEEEINKLVKPIKQYLPLQTTTKPNVVIVILEGFSAEYVGSQNVNTNIPNYKGYTPFLDSLSYKGAYFTQGYSNSSRSMDGMAAITASFPTFHTNFIPSPRAQQDISSVAKICKALGYQTAFMHGGNNGSQGFDGFSYRVGYDKYLGRTEFNDDRYFNGSWGIDDEPFLQYAKNEMSKMKEPFLATVFTLTSHGPYKVPNEHKHTFNYGDTPMQNVVAYADYSLKRFFDEAKKEPWYANTIFVLVADHPSGNFYEHYQNSVQYYRIPIVFFSPNEELIKPGEIKDIAQQIDIFPTLAHLIGYQEPFRAWGRSLFANDEPDRAYIYSKTHYQLLQGGYLYIVDLEGNIEGIYTQADHKMLRNLKDSLSPELTQKGIATLRAFMQDYNERTINQKLE